MEPGVGDAPASEVLDPEHHELSPRRPLLVPGDDCGDVVPSDAYEKVESHLLGSLFNLTPAFEPTELSCDAFDGEDALPISAETAADLDGSAVEQASAFETVDSVEPIHQGTVGLGVETAAAPAPVKRKRGRPPKVHGGGRKATVPKKKDEEEVCFICFDGGNLVVCDRRGCPKVYHPACIHRDESFFRPRSRWNCGWHICSICQKAVAYMCYTCTYSVCKACITRANFFSVRGQKGFCEACYKTIMLIESNEEANEEKIRVDFDDKSSWEYLFKVYWLTLKGKVSLTIEELSNARSSWKGSGTCLCKDETFDKLYAANGDQEACSDGSSKHCQNISLRKRVGMGSKRSVDLDHPAKGIEREKKSFSEDNRWASPALLEFVAHMKDGDNSVLSQFDVQALLLKYIKQNNLRDPRKKSQIVCDERLKNLFGKERVGHFEMLKLLESHFLIKEVHQIGTDDNQGAMDSDCGQMDDEEYSNLTNVGSDKRQKNRRRFGERELQSNLDDYAAIDVHNINLVYLRRNLMEDLIDDAKFTEKVVGFFVRIRIPAAGQKQEMYRLVQVIGTHLVSEKYKVGKKSTDIALDILNLNKMESSSIDAISNQDFTEEECRRLRQSIKCGLIRRLTVGDLLTKVKAIQEVRVKDWLASEKLRLSHLRDRASDLGRRKELRECIEKLQILDTPEEHQRRLGEISEIHVDPHMDPTYESPEETDDKKEDSFNRSSVPLSLKRGRDLLSPGRESTSSYQLNEATRTLSTDWISKKNHRPEDAGDKIAYNHAVKHDATVWNSTQLETKVENSYNAASETVIRSSGVSVTQYGSEHDKVWHYQDPSGKIQGAFSILQLRKWSSTGFFPPDLRVWLASKNQESMLLTDALLKFQTCSQQNSQTANLTQSPSFSGAANTGHNWDMGLRDNNNPPLADIKQNDHHSNANQNDATVSAAGYNVTNVDKQVLQVSNYSEQNRELITQGRVGASTRVWESSADINTWFDQHASYNIPDPKPSFSAPLSRSPYNSPAYQGLGMQVENAERWSRNQGNRSSWNSIKSRPIIPSGQGYEGQYHSQSPLSQQSLQVSQLYQQIQSPNNSRSQWENDGYSPPTSTLQPSSMSWTSHQAHTLPPSASVTSIHTVRYSWNAIPSAQLHQLGTNTMDTQVSVPLVDAVGGWSPKSSPNALDQYAEPKGWVSESATEISAADTNLDFGKMDNLSNSSLANQQKKPLSHPISSSASFRKNSQFFESSCPSPTPSSEEHGSSFPIDDSDSHKVLDGPSEDADVQSPVTTVPASGSLNRISPCLSAEVDGIQASMKSQAEMTDKITEIERLASLSYELENKQPSLAQTDDKVQYLTPITRAAYKPDALDNDSVQKSEALTDPKLAPEVTKDQDNLDYFGTNVAFLGNKLDQTETENPEFFSGLAHIDAKGIELASPYTTPTSGPYEWNAAVDCASGKNQSDILVSSVDFLPPLSPTITEMFAEPKSSRNTACEMADDSADNSWEIAPHCPRIGGAAHGAGRSMVSGVIVQEKTNVAWGTAEQTSTEPSWTMPAMKNAADTSTCWAKMTVPSREALNNQGNLNINTGRGAPQKTNPGWEPTMKISSGAESGWVLPATGYINQNENGNSSGGTSQGSKSASWSSANIYHENVDLQKRHGGDRYHEGSDSGYGGRYNSQTWNYFGGAGGPVRPLRGQGQRGVCKFYESGHCKKGALCNYLHPGE